MIFELCSPRNGHLPLSKLERFVYQVWTHLRDYLVKVTHHSHRPRLFSHSSVRVFCEFRALQPSQMQLIFTACLFGSPRLPLNI